MANSLNIATENFGKNSDYMFLHDPALYLDFHDGKGMVSIGFMEKEKVFRATSQYAKFATGIPATEVRRDIISQEFILEGKLKQFQKEVIAFVLQRRLDDSDTEWARIMIGTTVPESLFPSAVLIGKNVNGRELRLYIRKLQINTEDFEMAMGAEDYSAIPFKGYAQQDISPIRTNPTWLYIGKTVGTGDLTSASASIANLTPTAGIILGGAIVGTGIPEGATVTDITDLALGEIGISNAATETATGRTLYLENDSVYKDQDNIAFFSFKKTA